MAIQEAVNQLLGQAAMAGAFYAHSPSGKRAFELKDIKKKQKILTEKEDALTEFAGSDEFAKATEDLTLEQVDNILDTTLKGKELDEQLKELSKRREEIDPDYFKQQADKREEAAIIKAKHMASTAKKDEEKQLKAKEAAAEQQRQEEWSALDRKSTDFADNLINQVQREARAERRDWRIGAVQQLDLKNKFDAFLESLDEQMWNAGGNK